MEENKRAYDLSQKQRALEREVRKNKLNLRAYQTAIDACDDEETKQRLQEAYDRGTENLLHQNTAYNNFCKNNKLKRYDDRLRAAKWSRSEASKAAVTARNIEKFKEKVKAIRETSTGVQITDVSTHLYTRSKYRGPNADDISDALTKPLKLCNIRTDRSQQFIGETCTAVINVDTGKVISCWRTKSKLVAKLKAKGGQTS